MCEWFKQAVRKTVFLKENESSNLSGNSICGYGEMVAAQVLGTCVERRGDPNSPTRTNGPVMKSRHATFKPLSRKGCSIEPVRATK